MGPVSPVGPCREKACQQETCSRDTQESNLLCPSLTGWLQRRRATASPPDRRLPGKVSCKSRARAKCSWACSPAAARPSPWSCVSSPMELVGPALPEPQGEPRAGKGGGHTLISWVSILFTATLGADLLGSKVTAPRLAALSLQAHSCTDPRLEWQPQALDPGREVRLRGAPGLGCPQGGPLALPARSASRDHSLLCTCSASGKAPLNKRSSPCDAPWLHPHPEDVGIFCAERDGLSRMGGDPGRPEMPKGAVSHLRADHTGGAWRAGLALETLRRESQPAEMAEAADRSSPPAPTPPQNSGCPRPHIKKAISLVPLCMNLGRSGNQTGSFH